MYKQQGRTNAQRENNEGIEKTTNVVWRGQGTWARRQEDRAAEIF